MIFKLFIFLLVIGSCAAFGVTGERRVKDRRSALMALGDSIKSMKSALVYQGMTLPAALKCSGRGECRRYFEVCGELAAEKPGLCGDKCAQEAWKKEPVSELEPGDAGVIFAFAGAVFRAVSAEDAASACARYLTEVNSSVKQISESSLKKARLKKTLCILGGIVLCVIFI